MCLTVLSAVAISHFMIDWPVWDYWIIVAMGYMLAVILV